jgi:hypothetical protein
LPACGTPHDAEAFPPRPDGYSSAVIADLAAAAAWRSVALLIAGTPHVRISRDGGRTYPARHARPLPAEPPRQPCTVPVYDPGSATGRMLALDLDPARGDVDHQAAELGQLLEYHGVRVLADISPSGGRHLYVLFSSSLPWRELRDLARALSLRFPVIDPAPMCSLGGQISPPGARHKSGGWRVLSLSAELEHVARTGRWERSRYAGRSEARMAILSAAAARGWRLADVRLAITSGAWRGLPGLYERRSEPGRLDRLLPVEWRKAVDFLGGEKNVRGRPTSDPVPRPPVAEPFPAAEYGLIRQWLTMVLVASEDPERVRHWGGRVIAVRLVLLALGQAAMVSGSSVIEFGCRNLSLYSALSHRTVGRVLRMLADEDDPLIDLVSRRRLARADRYALRIPARYADSVRWRRRQAGRVEAAHPAFLELGGTAALVYEVLDGAKVRGAEVARAARLSPSAVSAALRPGTPIATAKGKVVAADRVGLEPGLRHPRVLADGGRRGGLLVVLAEHAHHGRR